MKEKLDINGEFIEVSVFKTSTGDYIGTANFIGELAMSICRHSNKKEAKNSCIERLLSNKHILSKK